MLNVDNIVEQKIQYHNKQIDIPNTLNNFNGTWNISDHSKIPEALLPFLMCTFKTGRLKRVSLDKINETLNNIWEGRGSMEKVLRITHELNQNVNFSNNDLPATKNMDVDDDIPVADRGYS